MSRSRIIAERHGSRAWLRKPLGILIVLLTVLYLTWRLTIFSDDWTFSLFFYLSEVIALFLGIVSVFGSWQYRHRESIPPAPDQKVDVFVPVYKEPLDMIRQTMIAAKGIKYPHETFLLDDGKRDELRDLAAEIGVNYLRRSSNHGAKAGNMNHALEHAQGDFILVFDADHIAQPEAIDALLGFFKDETVGVVVTPQDYYNEDSIQYINPGKDQLWHDQSRFYGIVQSCKDYFNASTSCGTGAFYRRKAIDETGGFQEISVTEDIHSTLLLHKAGYQSVYFNEAIAYGVAPTDIADYYRTRLRWSHGNLHVLGIEKPWKQKSLSWKQKISYCELGVIYLECWQQLLTFLLPIISVLTIWHPIEISSFNIFAIFTFPFLMIILIDEQGGGLNRNWASQLFTIARMPVQMVAWTGFFGKKIAWDASKKTQKGNHSWKLIAPQICLFVLSTAGFFFGLSRLAHLDGLGPLTSTIVHYYHGISSWLTNQEQLQKLTLDKPEARGYSIDLIAICCFWMLYNILRSGYWILDNYRRTRRTTSSYQFKIPLLMRNGEQAYQQIQWITPYEIGIPKEAFDMKIGEPLSIELLLPSGPLQIDAQITHATAKGYTAKFNFDDISQQDHLCSTLYSIDWHREMSNIHLNFPTLLDKLAQFLRFKNPPPRYHWTPGIRIDAQPQQYVITGHSSQNNNLVLLGFGSTLEGETISIRTADDQVQRYQVGSELPLQGWCRLGLDGITRWKARLTLLS